MTMQGTEEHAMSSADFSNPTPLPTNIRQPVLRRYDGKIEIRDITTGGGMT